MKVSEAKQYSLPRALNTTGLVVGRQDYEQFLAVRDTCFANYGLSDFGDEDALILESYADILKRGFDLGSVALGIKNHGSFIAGIAMFGSTDTNDDGVNIAQISLSGSFAINERPEAVTRAYGKHLRPALLAIAGASLVNFYDRYNLEVEYVTNPANESLAQYYQNHGFVTDNHAGNNLIMSLKVNAESIFTLAQAAQSSNSLNLAKA